jgi:hypothetical protein
MSDVVAPEAAGAAHRGLGARWGVYTFAADRVVLALMLGAALLHGQWRLGSQSEGTAPTIGGGLSPLTHDDFHAAANAGLQVLRSRNDQLFARSMRAAALGACVVVSNEVATITDQAGEAALAARGQGLAAERRVALMMGCSVIESMQPLFHTNRYRLCLPDGHLADWTGMASLPSTAAWRGSAPQPWGCR